MSEQNIIERTDCVGGRSRILTGRSGPLPFSCDRLPASGGGRALALPLLLLAVTEDFRIPLCGPSEGPASPAAPLSSRSGRVSPALTLLVFARFGGGDDMGDANLTPGGGRGKDTSASCGPSTITSSSSKGRCWEQVNIISSIPFTMAYGIILIGLHLVS